MIVNYTTLGNASLWFIARKIIISTSSSRCNNCYRKRRAFSSKISWNTVVSFNTSYSRTDYIRVECAGKYQPKYISWPDRGAVIKGFARGKRTLRILSIRWRSCIMYLTTCVGIPLLQCASFTYYRYTNCARGRRRAIFTIYIHYVTDAAVV